MTDSLNDAAEKLEMPVSHLMRLCMRIGMEHFKRIDYDTAKCIVEAVEKQTQMSAKKTTPAANAASPSATATPAQPPLPANTVPLQTHITPAPAPAKKQRRA
ncbi:MAG: hypothetical protein Q8M07_09500 [Prosthecobacter sp.]|nr:hypothetical protein [Prosthecobacter sp.]